MTHCKIISGTYFDEDNGEYQSYGVAVDNGTEKIVVEDISAVREEVEDLADRIVQNGLSVYHVDGYIDDWFSEIYDIV